MCLAGLRLSLKNIKSMELSSKLLDETFDDDDLADFNLGYQAGVMAERERILHGMQRLEDQSHATKTPLYQETMFTKIREIING